MYKHLVLWRLKNEVNGRSKTGLAREVKKRLDSLPGTISEIMEYEVGINIGAYDASFFDVGLISAFEDEEAFKRYCAYPEHGAVVAYVQSVTAAEEIVDFEV